MADYRDYRNETKTEPETTSAFNEASSTEQLYTQVQKAQAELTELKRRADQIERDKLRLEELTRRQEDFEIRSAEMIEKLTRAIPLLERYHSETEKRAQELAKAHQLFLNHLQTLQGIQPKNWIGEELSKELSKALSAVDDAYAEYEQIESILLGSPSDFLLPLKNREEYANSEFSHNEKGFFYWFKAGVAFTLPLSILASLGLLIWLWSLNLH